MSPYGNIEAVRETMGDDVACILVEPIQGEGGVIPAPPGFLKSLREIADASGALLCVDEIQTGIGRTGSFLATQQTSAMPDAIALAKALGGGVPIGAMLCTARLEAALPPGSHGSTFGGNPLASAAALKVLEVLERDNLMDAAREKGRRLQGKLFELVARFPDKLEDARGQGLLQALVLRPAVDGRTLLAQLRTHGLILTLAGGQALRFSPPLTVSHEELDQGLDILSEVLQEI